jgi:hypothetical protein
MGRGEPPAASRLGDWACSGASGWVLGRGIGRGSEVWTAPQHPHGMGGSNCCNHRCWCDFSLSAFCFPVTHVSVQCKGSTRSTAKPAYGALRSPISRECVLAVRPTCRCHGVVLVVALSARSCCSRFFEPSGQPPHRRCDRSQASVPLCRGVDPCTLSHNGKESPLTHQFQPRRTMWQ